MTDFKSLMESARKRSEEGGDFESLPVGKYVARITGCFRNKSQNGEGRNQTNFDWEVVEGELKGKTHRSFHNLDHEVGLAIFIQDMKKFNIDAGGIEKLEDVDEMLRTIQGMSPVCAITLAQSKGFINTRLNEVMGTSEETPDEPEQSITVGSTIKFKHGGATKSEKIVAVNETAQTVDTVSAKGVPLADIVELV